MITRRTLLKSAAAALGLAMVPKGVKATATLIDKRCPASWAFRPLPCGYRNAKTLMHTTPVWPYDGSRESWKGTEWVGADDRFHLSIDTLGGHTLSLLTLTDAATYFTNRYGCKPSYIVLGHKQHTEMKGWLGFSNPLSQTFHGMYHIHADVESHYEMLSLTGKETLAAFSAL
jgi:hypothetical protein